MFNVQTSLLQDMESILARLYGTSQAWMQCVYCQTPKSDYFSFLKNPIVLFEKVTFYFVDKTF